MAALRRVQNGGGQSATPRCRLACGGAGYISVPDKHDTPSGRTFLQNPMHLSGSGGVGWKGLVTMNRTVARRTELVLEKCGTPKRGSTACVCRRCADRQNTRPHVWNCLATKSAKENTMIANRTRVVAKTLKAGARQMSSATEQEAKEQMGRWTQISKGMMGLTGVYTVVQFVSHFGGHEHHEEAPKYAYLKLRNKPFPWHYANCDLLDTHCKELARAAEQALKDE